MHHTALLENLVKAFVSDPARGAGCIEDDLKLLTLVLVSDPARGAGCI